MKTKHYCKQIILVILLVAALGLVQNSVRAQTFTWTNKANGNFSGANNWSPSGAPSSGGAATVNIRLNAGGNTILTDDLGAFLLNSITNVSGNQYTIQGSAVNHLVATNNGSVTPTFYHKGGNFFYLNSPVVLGANLTIYLDTGASTFYANSNITESVVGSTLNLAGIAGSLDLHVANSYTGGTTNSSPRTLQIDNIGALGTGPLTMNYSGAIFNNTVSGNLSNAVVLASNATFNVGGNMTNIAVISGSGGLTKIGASTLALAGTNTYSGNTVINSNTLALVGIGLITNSAAIVVASNCIFNVSGLSSAFTLAQSLSGQRLSNSAPGAIINGTNNCSAGTLSLVYDKVNPSFIITNGGMTLSASTTVNINNTGTAMLAGSYLIISNVNAGTHGLVAGTAPSSVTVGGNGIGFSSPVSVLSITANGLVLTLSSAVAASTTVSLTSSDNAPTNAEKLIFTATVQTNSPTGTATTATSNVVFSVDGVAVFTNALVNGVATYTNSTLTAAGSPHAILATYLGDANFLNSQTTLSQTVNVGTDYLLWTGAANTNWDYSTTNWVLHSTAAATPYADGWNLVFNDTGTNTTNTLLISPAPGPITVTNQTQNYTFLGTNKPITGSATLTKQGTGTLTLANGTNTYSGLTLISGGTLNLGNGTTDANVTSAIEDNATLVYNNGSSQTAPAISGTGSVIKNGAGTLTLGSNNSLTGVLTVSAGTVAISNGLTNNFSGITLNGGTLNFAPGIGAAIPNNVLGYGTLTVTTNGGTIFANPNSSPALTLSSNIWGGNFTINAGNTISMGVGGALLTTNVAISATVPSSGSGTHSWTFGGTIGDGGNGYGVTFTNIGYATPTTLSLYFILSVANTYGGDTTIAGSPTGTNMNLTVGDPNGIPNANYNANSKGNLYVNDYGRLNLATNASINGLNGTALGLVTLGTNTLNLGYNNATASFPGVISGTGGLVKTGTGTQTISGNSTYSGATTISNGTLALGAAGSIGNSTNISVAAGALFDVSAVSGYALGGNQVLSGSGSINGSVIANGIIRPGAANSIGTLTFSNSLTINSNLVFKLNESLAQSNDVISVLGTVLTNTGVGTLTVTNLGPALAVGDTFYLFNQAVTGNPLGVTPPAGYTMANNLALNGSVTVTGIPLSTNAYLKSLVVSNNAGALAFYPSSFTTNNYGIYYATNVYGGGPVTVTVTNGNLMATNTLFLNNVSQGAITSGIPSLTLTLGSGLTSTVAVEVVSQDLSRTNLYNVEVYQMGPPPLSTNAYLAGLVLNPNAGFAPAFTPNGYLYYATNSYGQTPTVTVTNADAAATNTLIVNGVTVGILTNEVPSAPLTLGLGNTNVVAVRVVSQDLSVTNTYVLNVTRLASVFSSDASLSFLELNPLGALTPAFASGTTNYTATEANANSTVTVLVTNTSAFATNVLFLNGNPLATNAGALTVASLPLVVGSANNIHVQVTAQDGLTVSNYYVTVTRAASSNAGLTSLALTPAGTLYPTFATGTLIYTATNTCASATPTVTVTNADVTATNTLYLNGVSQGLLTNGVASGQLTLVTGSNNVTVEVVSQDLSVTNDYVTAVTLTAPPTVSVNSVTNCGAVATLLTATTSASSPTYSWSPGGATTASITVTPSSTTSYTVTVTDGTTGCANSGSGTITVNPVPTVSVNSTNIFAGGSATLTATTSASSPIYSWSPGGATTASITVTPSTNTTYTVTVTDGTTGCANSGSGAVTILPSTNALLASLTITPAGTLYPTFSSGTTIYNATNTYVNRTPLTVAAGSVDANATLALNFNNSGYGPVVTNSLSSSGNTLVLPTNMVAVQVVSQDLSRTNVYTVNVLLQPSQTVPKLTNSVSGGTNLVLSWPADHLGYRLLVQTNNLNKGVSGNTNDWGTVPGSTSITTTNITIIKSGVTNEYYRLVYP